jgi:hypothetical protein
LLLIFLVLFAGQVLYGHDVVLLTTRPGNLLKARGPFPKAPFRFVEEDKNGSTPKVVVRDARGATWSVKFGEEVKAEVFATRFVAALGYYSDVSHYVPNGRILGAHGLKRADKYIDARGRFRGARFEYRNPSARFVENAGWTWKENPFTGSREFDGLKILVMLLSNWDNKDASDRTSNTGILERRAGRSRQRIYYVTDWGGAMGRWGHLFFRSKWDCDGFADQSEDFIKAIDDGEVKFGFGTGNHGGDFKERISAADVAWVSQRFRGITDSQLRIALRQSGANAHEAAHFTRALRLRMKQMEAIATMGQRRMISARSKSYGARE